MCSILELELMRLWVHVVLVAEMRVKLGSLDEFRVADTAAVETTLRIRVGSGQFRKRATALKIAEL